MGNTCASYGQSFIYINLASFSYKQNVNMLTQMSLTWNKT